MRERKTEFSTDDERPWPLTKGETTIYLMITIAAMSLSLGLLLGMYVSQSP